MNSKLPGWIGGTLALAAGIGAAVVGFELTGWALAGPRGPTFLDYLIFAGLTLMVAAMGAMPGLLVGWILRLMMERGPPVAPADQSGV